MREVGQLSGQVFMKSGQWTNFLHSIIQLPNSLSLYPKLIWQKKAKALYPINNTPIITILKNLHKIQEL